MFGSIFMQLYMHKTSQNNLCCAKNDQKVVCNQHHSSLKRQSQLLPEIQLTFAKMCVDAHVSRSARQTLVFTVWNVLIVLGVDVFLGKAKVNYIYCTVFVG